VAQRGAELGVPVLSGCVRFENGWAGEGASICFVGARSKAGTGDGLTTQQ
jgi:hypothetical protein